MKKVLVFALFICCAVALVGCDSGVTTSGNPTDEGGAPAKDTVYKLGDKVTVSKDSKDLYTVTINGVTVTEKRNPYWEKEELKQVIVINYTYENLTKDDDLYVSSAFFKVIDGDGNVCEVYPTVDLKPAQSTPVGAKCTAEGSYGLMSDSKDFKLMLYDNMFNKADATFELSVAQ